MKIQFSNTKFNGKPRNYAKIDNFVSRSAQPEIANFKWLKEQGVTDVINFRTMSVPNISFVEKDVVENLGMNYHNIQSVSKYPNEEKIHHFLDLVNKIKQNNGKVHIHCMAGADRTGMYSFIYKMLNGLGSFLENELEWIQKGLNLKKYPTLIEWTENFVINFKKIHLPK